ncbi:MAG: hypothetical protein KKG76_12090 [Euryarchaeota archaeon]|nr:hypothetical protein [Euryarchaeota archaeon]
MGIERIVSSIGIKKQDGTTVLQSVLTLIFLALIGKKRVSKAETCKDYGLAANVARQNDENLKRFYDKKISEGKHHFSALNAVAAKLLRIVYWVLKNKKEYHTQLN